MLNLANTTDKIQLVTSAAAAVDVHASWADLSAGVVTPGRTNTAITTAATTDVVPVPAASTVRNVKTLHIRNKDVVISTDVAVVYNQNGTTFELHKVTLVPGATLEYVEGVGFYQIVGIVANLSIESVSAQSPFAADTYLVGSNILLPGNLPVVGTMYHLAFDVTKTAVGTATPIVTVRMGTTGSITDAARCAFTFGAGTTVIDVGRFDIFCVFRTVGSGTSAVLQGTASVVTNLTTTGLSNAVKTVVVTSAGFDSTPANSIIGASYNGGASAVHTIQLVRTEVLA